MGKFLIFSVLATAFLAYLLNPAVPGGLEERFKYRSFFAFFNACHLWAELSSMLSSGDRSNNVVMVTNNAICLLADHYPTDHFGPGVITTEGVFDGTRVLIYRPPMTSDQLLPGFVYFHGGGLALATANFSPLFLTTETFDGLAKKIAYHVNAVVVNVDYDTTPNNKFPGPVNQAFAAVKWFMTHAEEYGVDPNRIAVGGDSAGGYLSSVTSYLVREDDSIPNLKLQILIYPWTQCLDLNFPSYQKYTMDFGPNEGIVCRPIMAEFCSLHAFGSARQELVGKFIENKHVSPSFRKSALYRKTFGHELLPAAYRDNSYYNGASQPDEGDEDFWNESKQIFLDPRFTPHFIKNMTGLPTAYVMTAGYDSLRDEGYLYAQQLKKAGVDVTLVHYERAWHGVHWVSPEFVFRLGEKIHNDFLNFVKERL
ncbi:Neutral cholesterol ester hydrolase 1 [Holothuria leucospilota]|uniref:Neutral cholesterol ester hydrolase 1 n=1 Tax=Holothuria leucospilota TaxID=206669 RepID=A0A9Q1BQ60_HOLLE|nr:Neutral cholesterol ester hydrolase 1 [Holothuria leucospilota]